MKMLIQFPTLGRPEKFLACLQKYITMSSGAHSLVFNVNCDQDDQTMQNPDVISQILKADADYKHVEVILNYNSNTSKIDAINQNIGEVRGWKIVICASDDMVPYAIGWDDHIAKRMVEHFPDFDGCVFFDDSHAGSKLITFSILGRKLYDYFGYIYHPDYKALYCDNEFTQEVSRLGRVAYIDEVIIRHEHYAEQGNSNSGDFDTAAKKTLHYSGRDRQVFELRSKLRFPKERVTSD